VAIFALALVGVSLVHIWMAPTPDFEQQPISRVYLWTIPAYYSLLGLLIGLASAIFALHPLTWPVWRVGAWALLVYLIANIGVFNLYGFHIDLVLLRMFVFDFNGIGIPLPILGLFCLTGLAIAWGIARVHRLTVSASTQKKGLNFLALAVLFLTPPTYLLNQSIHAWGLVNHQSNITQYTPLFPLYFPIDSRESVEYCSSTFPNITPKRISEIDQHLPPSPNRQSQLNFPKSPFNCSPKAKDHVLLIILESWQAKSLRSDSMPRLYALAKDATLFNSHVSSGSATVPGFFGLFYGLHPSYYDSIRARAAQYPAPLTEIANELGYYTRVFTSGDLERFSLRKMFFSRVREDNFSYFKDDEALVEKYIQSIRQRDAGNPAIDVLYLTSSHSPYRYPDSETVFRPIPSVEGAYALNKQIDPTPFKNDYLNSLHYLDTLIGSIFSALRATSRFENTWIVITGDHGEEFNESGLGHWGHGSNFSQWQTGTPMIIKRAKQRKGEVVQNPTFHQDLAPTLIQDLYGCKNQESDFSNGLNLARTAPSRHAVINSYVSQAYWIDGHVWERNTGRNYSWFDPKDSRQMSIPSDRLRQLLEEESRFRKPIGKNNEE